jgi:formate dehydrogenase
LADLIVFVTGNLGRKGGMYKPTGFADFHPPVPLDMIKVETSLGELSYTAPGPIPLPTVALPELIEAGDIKALVCLAGNPLLSAGGATKLRAALGKLDLLVAMDIQRNSTAEVADYLLPATDFLERADINMVARGSQPNPYVHYTDAVVSPKYERRNDFEVLLEIAKKMGVFPGEDPDGWGIINKILEPDGLSIDKLKALPHQTHSFENKPYDDVYAKCLKHPDGKIHCFPAAFEAAGLFERCDAIFEELQNEDEDVLKMISMRSPYMHNTWFSNVKKFRRGAQSINPLRINSEDAKARGITDGEIVKVYNTYGEIETPVIVDDDMRRGAVAMSHGYGKGRAAMRNAEANPGANPNELAPNTMDTVEPLSNMSWIGAYPVRLERLNG